MTKANSTTKSALRSRAWRERRKAAGAKAAQPKKVRKAKAEPATDYRKEAARAAYAELKAAGGRAYEAMKAAARVRAAAYHDRQRKAKKAEARAARKGA